MPLLLKKSKAGLRASLKAANLKLTHGYDIKKRKVTKRKKKIASTTRNVRKTTKR